MFGQVVTFLGITPWKPKIKAKKGLYSCRNSDILLLILILSHPFALASMHFRRLSKYLAAVPLLALIAHSSVIITKINVAKVGSQHAAGRKAKEIFPTPPIHQILGLPISPAAAFSCCIVKLHTFRLLPRGNILEKTMRQSNIRWLCVKQKFERFFRLKL